MSINYVEQDLRKYAGLVLVPLSQVCSQEALKSSQACLTRRGFPKKTTPSKVGDVRQALPLHLEKGEKSNGLQ